MNIARHLSPLRFLGGAALITIGGAAAFGFLTAYYTDIPGYHISGQFLTEHVVVCIGVGTATFVCASTGYFLLRSVRRSRLHPAVAGLMFPVLAVGCAFVPAVIMNISRTWSPFAFTGDSGWDYLVAPMMASPFLLALVIAFTIGLFVCRRRQNSCS